MENLADIKDFEKLFNLYEVWLWIIFLLGFVMIIFFMTKWAKKKYLLKNKALINAKKALKNLDLNDSKNASYALSKYLPILAKKYNFHDDLGEFFQKLETYKYQKNVPLFSDDIRKQIEKILKNCHV